jgi:integrase
VPEKSDTDKEQNRKTLETANKIKSKMILEMGNEEHGFTNDSEKQKSSLIEYITAFAKQKKRNGASSMYYSINSIKNHLTNYKGKTVTFRQVTKDYCKGFIEYLKNTDLAERSQGVYNKVLTVILNSAMRDGYLQNNPMNLLHRHEILKQPESDREFLTVDEIKQLVKTPCAKPDIKLSFLFVCFSGLRFSDVRALRWGDIQADNAGKNVIRYTQKKTGKNEYLQVSDEAIKHLPERNGKTDDDKIFNLTQNGYANETLAGWVLAAGIKKRVTFHVGRHTNATLLLSLGVPIETVSKLLGHSDIKITQIYAKVVDKNKREAVSKLDGLMTE